MKIIKSSFILCLIVAIVAGCSKDNLLDLNEDVKNPQDVSGEYLFSYAQKTLSDHMASTNVNDNILKLWSQYWTECQYPDETQYDLTKRNIPRQVWTNFYRNTLGNLSRAKELISAQTILEGLPADEANRVTKESNNKLAIADILMVYTYSRLVDTFGNIPYSEALDIDATSTPKYDDAETIYVDLFKRLETSLATLDPGHSSFTPAADYIYNGDVASWITFANSLKFKMAITVADVPSLNPAEKALQAVGAGIISSQAENAYYPYVSGIPNTNPLWVDLVSSGRKDFVAANTLIDYMNDLEDPRREFYFDSNLMDTIANEPIYKGGTYGATNVYKNNTQVNLQFRDPTYPNTILSYSEMQFYLAEAAENGLLGGVAETFYNEAIRASIVDDWKGTQADADAYLARPDVAYGTAPGTWKEKIAMQEWIAFYMRGLEGWTTWRRLDAPVLNTPPMFDADADFKIPVRYRYPIEEQTINGANYQAASTAIGGDEKETPIFWDKH